MCTEFQAVILAAGRGSRMYPLTEECPKALLTVGNYPLIWYPVQLLDKNGFDEVFVVVRDSAARAISDVLTGFRNMRVSIKFSLIEIPEAEDWGTADTLRHIRAKIKSDVLLLSCDLITTIPLRQLTDFHRIHNCTLTTLLVRDHTPQGDGGSKRRDTPIERDIVGLVGESRLVYFTAQADLDDNLVLSRALLKKHPHVRLSTQLLDAHLYLIKKWVIDYLGEHKSLSSVKGELLPFLVRQHSLLSHSAYTKPLKQALQRYAQSCEDPLEQESYEMSSFGGRSGSEFTEDLIRCHALLVDQDITMRVNTLPAFTEANRMICHHLGAFGLEKASSQPSWRSKGVSISPDSVVAATVQLAEKVSIKKANIGEHCSIGERSKVINCVIMDHVHIGEGCSLQSCVVCSHARIEDRVTLKDCHIGANFTITKEADMRGETLVVGGGLHF